MDTSPSVLTSRKFPIPWRAALIFFVVVGIFAISPLRLIRNAMAAKTAVAPLPFKFNGTIGVKQSLNIGSTTMIDSSAPSGMNGVLFVDDGITGRFLAVDPKGGEQIFDCLDVYNSKQVAPADKSTSIVIIWSPDSLKALLVIGGIPQAVFDFTAHRGMNKGSLPTPGTTWLHDSLAQQSSSLRAFQITY